MRSTNRFITLLLFGLASVIGITGQVMAEDGSTQRAVLVTGASSGIGKKVTELLAAKGHFVYAGARKDDDLAALDKLDNVKAVRLDVTKQSDIDAAVELIGKEGRGLYGIVNNAGVAVVSPMNETPEKDIDFVFDVNIYGPYRINKAFAPMLVEAGGRTTTIGSISGVREPSLSVCRPTAGSLPVGARGARARPRSVCAPDRRSLFRDPRITVGDGRSTSRTDATFSPATTRSSSG